MDHRANVNRRNPFRKLQKVMLRLLYTSDDRNQLIIYEEFFLVSLSCFSKSDSYFPIILYFFTFRNSCLIFLRENVRRLKATRWQIGARLNCDLRRVLSRMKSSDARWSRSNNDY